MTEIHETNLPQATEALDETQQAVQTVANTEAQDAATANDEPTNLPDKDGENAVRKLSKDEVIARLQTIAEHIEEATKSEIDLLKQTFYKLHNAEIEAAKKAFVDNGGAEADFVPQPDPAEEQMKQAMAVIKEKRNRITAELEKIKEMNYQVKLTIIEELKELIDSPEDPNTNYNEFKKLQQQWNEVTLVPQGKMNELWKNYQANVEKFYDLLKLSNEFREYDFKKNLEIKTRLCEQAEKLTEEADVVAAFHQLQKLHQEYRSSGPVSKELREEIWARFKAASTTINRKHQQHFEELKKSEQDNINKKTAICEAIEQIDYTKLKTFKQWDAKTEEVLALQAEWKQIGYASQKVNARIFDRFRKACDTFFQNKAVFFKDTRAQLNENAEKRRALCEKAEALKDSTDWKQTTDELVKLQKEWKTIGPATKKISDALWKRFVSACDHFFEQKARSTSSARTAEQENLGKKRGVIEQLKALSENIAESDTMKKLKDLQAEWNNIGHVPFKEKDKVYAQYREIVDSLYNALNANASSNRIKKFRNTVSDLKNSGAQTVNREREKLARVFEALSSELHTYQNNLGFLNTSSKSGNALLNELHKKMEKLENDIAEVKEKIRLLDESKKAE